MSKALRLLAVGFLAWAGGTLGAEPLSLTVDQAVDLAVKNNLTLKGEALQLEAKQRSRDLSWNAFIPKTTVGTALSRLNNQTSSFVSLLEQIPSIAPYVSGASQPAWIASASFSAQLNISLALFDGIRHTKLDYEAGALEAEAARQQLARDTKKAFYNLLLLRANLNTFADQLENARQHYEKEKRSYDSGQGSEFSMLNAQVAWENLKPSLDEMKIAMTVAELTFRQTLGLEPAAEFALDGSLDLQFPSLNTDGLVARAIAQNPALASVRQAIRIQQNLRRGQFDLSYLPVLGFSLTADPTFQKDPFANPWFSNISKDWQQSNGMFSVYLSLPLDQFLPFSGTAVTLANMDTQIAGMENSLEIAVQGKRIQVTSLALQLEKSRQAIERLELNVMLANRAYQMAEKGFESGAYELLQVQDADAKLQQAKLNVLSEKYAALSSLFDLEFETNQTLLGKSHE